MLRRIIADDRKGTIPSAKGQDKKKSPLIYEKGKGERVRHPDGTKDEVCFRGKRRLALLR